MKTSGGAIWRKFRKFIFPRQISWQTFLFSEANSLPNSKRVESTGGGLILLATVFLALPAFSEQIVKEQQTALRIELSLSLAMDSLEDTLRCPPKNPRFQDLPKETRNRYCSSCNTDIAREFACASIAVDESTMIWLRVKAVISSAMSASRITDSELSTFSWAIRR